MIALTREQQAAVAEAIGRAEARTRAEIICVVARMSSDYAALPAIWTGVLALAVPWPLIVFTQLSVQAIYALQLASFLLFYGVLSWRPVRLALVPRALRRAQVHRAAAEQFVARGVTRTNGRSGVLIFISLAERSMRVMADEAVEACVPREDWQGIVNACVAELREQRLAEGLLAAIDRCADLLAERFPDDGSARNELPNRVYLL